MTPREDLTYHQLPGAQWARLPTEEATKSYDLLKVTHGVVNLEDLFGSTPEHFHVHHGSLKLSGPQRFMHRPDRTNRTVFVVEGDVSVDGPLSLCSLDVYTPLWIRGSLCATDLVLACDVCLIVEGSVQVKGSLVADLCDAAHLVVSGPLAATAVIDLAGQGNVDLAGRPTARILGVGGEPLQDSLLPEFMEGGKPSIDVLREALLAGRAILK